MEGRSGGSASGSSGSNRSTGAQADNATCTLLSMGGSPRLMRSAKACFSASVMRCTPTLPLPASGCSYPARSQTEIHA